MNLPLLRNTIDSVKRQLQEARDYKASLELRAMLPPADASEPELYSSELKPHIDRATGVITAFEAELTRLEAQLQAEEAAPVQLDLLPV